MRVRGSSAAALVAAVCVVAVAAGCSTGGSTRALTPVTVPTRGKVVPSGRVVPFAGALWAVAGPVDGPQHLVRSPDGAAWSTVDLPAAPRRLWFAPAAPRVVGGTLAVTGRALEVTTTAAGSQEAPTGQYFVWTSRDGDRWDTGPRLDLAAPFDVPQVQPAGRSLVVGATGTDGTFHMFRQGAGAKWTEARAAVDVPAGTSATVGPLWTEQGATVGHLNFDNLVGVAGNRDLSAGPPPPEHLRSTDGGRTWTTSKCDPNPRYTCGGQGISARGLLVRGGRSSTDGGRTWQQVTVDPAPGDRCPDLEFRSVTAVAGGWVADASFDYAGGPSDHALLRSTDGAAWTYTTPGRCPSPADRYTTYSPPVRFDRLWWTVRSTADGEAGPSRQALLRSADGHRWAPAVDLGSSTTDDPHGVGEPVVLGDRLLVPVFDGRYRLERLEGLEK